MKSHATALTLFLAATFAAYAAETKDVLVPAHLAAELEGVAAELGTIRLHQAATVEEAAQQAPEAEAVIGFPQGDVVEAAVELEWLQTLSAGVEHVVFRPELDQREVTLTNAKIIMGPEIADHAFALLLTLTRNTAHHIRHPGRWDRQGGLPYVELRGKTMLIIGLGGIGMQVAERAAAFGMRVVATDPKDVSMVNSVEYVGKPDELRALLPAADVVVSCAPRTPETEGLLGEEEFDLMKEGVYVINVSRGAVIDTAALIAALESGVVAGAGLDVTDPEPLAADHPLWDFDHVVITPHVAGISEGMRARRLALVQENLRRFAEGLPLRNTVDKDAGY